MSTRERVRIAIQKSGRLGDPARDLLARCGLRFRQGPDKLFCYGEDLPLDLLLVRDDDIPELLLDGSCDLGVLGRNVLLEAADPRDAARQPTELRELGFGGCRLAIALPDDVPWQGIKQLEGLRVATSHPALLASWLAAHEVNARVVVLAGSVEIAPRLGKADAVCDLVSSGATLAANQLREVATVMESQAVLAGSSAPLTPSAQAIVDTLLRRLDGVLHARRCRLVMLQAPRAALAAIANALPGSPRTTVTPIEGSPDHVAMQAVCNTEIDWRELEAMQIAGATDLLVLPLEKMMA